MIRGQPASLSDTVPHVLVTLFQNEEKEQDKTRARASLRWTSRCTADALPFFLAPSFPSESVP